MVDWPTVIYVSVPWATVLSLVLYFVKNPEKAEKWYSILSRSVSYWSQRAERATVASDIQSDIALFSKNMNEKAGGSVLPDGVKIQWERGEMTKEAFLRGNQMIIRMSHHRNQARNFLNATLSYVTTGFLRYARHQLESIVRRSLDLAITRKLLSEKKRNTALQMFYEEIYNPEKNREPLIGVYHGKLDLLDDHGLLNLVLREFSDLGLVMYEKAPEDVIKKETRMFIDFLEKIATKKPEIKVPLDFKGLSIKSNIVLVARPELARERSVTPFIEAVLRGFDRGANTIYVIARGPDRASCKQIATRVGEIFDVSPTIRKVAVLRQRLPFYEGRKLSSIIIILKATT